MEYGHLSLPFYETTYCKRDDIKMYLYKDGAFTPASSDWFTYDPDTDYATFLPAEPGSHSMFFTHTSNGKIQSYNRIDITVCGEETLALVPGEPDPAIVKLDFD